MDRVAARLGMREGQLWTIAIGLVVAVVLGIFGAPATSHHTRPASTVVGHP
ncbi:MAG: hypothetical protein ACYDH6_08810 [Acidimicrobiales bacterium]